MPFDAGAALPCFFPPDCAGAASLHSNTEIPAHAGNASRYAVAIGVRDAVPPVDPRSPWPPPPNAAAPSAALTSGGGRAVPKLDARFVAHVLNAPRLGLDGGAPFGVAGLDVGGAALYAARGAEQKKKVCRQGQGPAGQSHC